MRWSAHFFEAAFRELQVFVNVLEWKLQWNEGSYMVLCGFLIYGALQKLSFTLKKQTKNPHKPQMGLAWNRCLWRPYGYCWNGLFCGWRCKSSKSMENIWILVVLSLYISNPVCFHIYFVNCLWSWLRNPREKSNN